MTFSKLAYANSEIGSTPTGDCVRQQSLCDCQTASRSNVNNMLPIEEIYEKFEINEGKKLK